MTESHTSDYAFEPIWEPLRDRVKMESALYRTAL